MPLPIHQDKSTKQEKMEQIKYELYKNKNEQDQLRRELDNLERSISYARDEVRDCEASSDPNKRSRVFGQLQELNSMKGRYQTVERELTNLIREQADLENQQRNLWYDRK